MIINNTVQRKCKKNERQDGEKDVESEEGRREERRDPGEEKGAGAGGHLETEEEQEERPSCRTSKASHAGFPKAAGAVADGMQSLSLSY